ncbi:MAG: RasGEF domain-containing protein [Parachlamydiaceae bacterium]
MTIPGVELNRIMPTKEGWKSLLIGKGTKHSDVILELFQDYHARLEDTDLLPYRKRGSESFKSFEEREVFCTSVMQDCLSDLLMKYTILSDSISLGKLKVFSYQVPDGNKLLFAVQELFKTFAFDPLWKYTQAIAEFDINRSVVDDEGLKAIQKKYRSGYLNLWIKYPISRYRIVSRLNIQRAQHRVNIKAKTQKRPLTLKNAYLKESRFALKVLNPDRERWGRVDPGPYFFALLRHHSPLAETLAIFEKLSTKSEMPSPKESPVATDPIRRKSTKISVSRRTESEPALRKSTTEKVMQAVLEMDNGEMKAQLSALRNQSPSSFPNFVLTAPPPEVIFTEQAMINALEAGEPKDQWQECVRAIEERIPSLPFKQIKKALPYILEHLKDSHQKSPKSLVLSLSKLARVLFNMPFRNEHFWPLVEKIAIELSLAKDQELASLKGNISNAWDLFFQGKDKEKVLYVIIHDLKLATSGLFRSLTLREFNPDILKYLEDPQSEDQESTSLEQLKQLFNQLFCFIQAKIQSGGKEALETSLELADHMMKTPVINVHLLMAVSAAISKTSPSIVNALGDNHQKILATLERHFKPQPNYANLREFMRRVEAPFVPYTGMMQADFDEAAKHKKGVRELAEDFFKIRSLVKATLPIKGIRSDALPFKSEEELDPQFITTEQALREALQAPAPKGNETPPLSLDQIEAGLPRILESFRERLQDSPKVWTTALAKLVSLLYKLPFNRKGFSSLIELMAKDVKKAKKAEQSKLKGNVTEAWETLFQGKADDHLFSAIIQDLNSESAKCFGSIVLYEVNPKILDFLHKIPLNEDKKSSTSLEALKKLSNELYYFVRYKILKKKEKALEATIELADRMFKSPVVNVHLLLALYAAIDRTPASTLEHLDENHQKMLKELARHFQLQPNYKNLREFLKESEDPFLPSVGIFQADFEFAVQLDEERDEAIQKKTVTELTNDFLKLRNLLGLTLPVTDSKTDAIASLNDWQKPLRLKPEKGKTHNELLDDYLYKKSRKKKIKIRSAQ